MRTFGVFREGSARIPRRRKGIICADRTAAGAPKMQAHILAARGLASYSSQDGDSM